jgi:hypothetical protein
MFPHDYLEIRSIADRGKFLAGVDKFLEQGEGFYSVAFNAHSADECYRAGVEAGLDIEAPKALNRKLILDDKVLDLHFRTAMIGRSLYPGLTHANLCEHLTADTLRQPGWLDHPNGAISFGRLVGVISDFDAAHTAYVRLLGPERVRREINRIMLDFREGADVELITAEEAEQRGDAHPNRGVDYFAAAALLVKDVAGTAHVLERNGVLFTQLAEGVLKVDPADACGAHLYFQQA